MQVFLLSLLLYSLRVSAVLDHFGYPAPHLDQWQQRVWYNLGATQEVLHQMCIHLSRGLPTIASPPRAESPSQLQRRSVLLMRGDSLRPQEVGAQPPAPQALGHPRL